jgi:hypothetical protein
MHIVAKNINLGDAAKEAMKALNNKSVYVMEETQVQDLEEAVKTTHENPLVTVHDKHGLHTHANLSTVNNLFSTSVKHTEVHKGPVTVTSGRADKDKLKIALSSHHNKAVTDDAMKEEYDLDEQGVSEAFADQGSGHTGTSREDKRIAALLRARHMAKKTKPIEKVKTVASEEVEEVDQIDELKIGTLVRYASKAGKSALSKGIESGRARDMGDDDKAAALKQKSDKRYAGQGQAIGKINNRFKSGVNVGEEVELDEGRPSQQHPLEGHAYHKKSNAELEYIAKDATEAAEAMKSHNTTAENKYRDQANDSATVRHFRKRNGMPDWYKKKYGHIKEEVESVNKLVGNQHKIDANKNGKVDAHDFKLLRSKKKQPQGADFAAQRRKERLASSGRMDERYGDDDYGSMSKRDFKRREMEHELGGEGGAKRKSSNSNTKVQGSPLLPGIRPYSGFKKEETELTFEEMTPAQKAERLRMIARAADRVHSGAAEKSVKKLAKRDMKSSGAQRGMAPLKKDVDEQIQILRKTIVEGTAREKIDAYKELNNLIQEKLKGEE